MARGRLAAFAAALFLLLAAGCADGAEAPDAEGVPVAETVTPAPTRAPATDGRPATGSVAPSAAPRDVSGYDLRGGQGAGEATTTGGVATVEELLEKGLYLAEASPAHLAIRGTASGDTVRCAWRGIARTRRLSTASCLASQWSRLPIRASTLGPG